MGRIGRGVVVVGAFLLLACVSRAQEVPAPGADAREARLAERERLREEFQAVRAKGDARQTLAAVQKILAVEREIFGDTHGDVADTLGFMAELLWTLGDFPAARRCQAECLEIRVRLHGPDHWKVTDARVELEEVEQRAKLTPEQELRYREALDLHDTVMSLNNEGRFAEAISPATRVVATWTALFGEEGRLFAAASINLARAYLGLGKLAKAKRYYRQGLEARTGALGEEHPWTAEVMRGLANVHGQADEYAKAEDLHLRSLEIVESALGREHRAYGEGLNDLSVMYQNTGELRKALPLLLQAVEIKRKALGEGALGYGASLSNLGALYRDLNRPRKAEPLYREALAIFLSVRGEDHPGTAVVVHNLGNVLEDMGELEEAEAQYQRSLAITRRALGEEHPDYASTSGQLANLHAARGEYEKAERLFKEALEIQRKTLGAEHSRTAATLNNLALMYRDAGDHESAVSHLEQALEILRKTHGESHPNFATSLANLADMHWRVGDLVVAEDLHRKVLRIREEVLGPGHLGISISLHDLARCCLATGRISEAEALLGRGLSIVCRYMDLTSSLQSEREQLRLARRFRSLLDARLSVSAADEDPGVSYTQVLAWKGAVYARKAAIRALHGPDLTEIGERFDHVSRQLAKLAFAGPEKESRPDAWRERIKDLTRDREKLEAELYRRSAEYRRGLDAARLTPERLAELLPPGVALVDLLEYDHLAREESDKQPALRRTKRMVAFVTRRGEAVRRVDLGLAAPIREAVESWRKEMGDAAPLGRLVWEPLEECVKGASTILVSPDGPLCRFPFAALPGEEPGTWLVEEAQIAVLPVPQLLPLLFAEPAPAANGGEDSLLLVGDVEYGGTPGKTVGEVGRSAAGTGTDQRPLFGALPGTRAEILAIRDSFETRFEEGAVKMLRRDGATEAALRAEVSKHRWLHLATHGFFAPPGLRVARGTGLHPGLLSGLALSGANTPPEPDGDDGILTALEVESLDLTGVRTAVLSACETGLGEVAAGEGVMGLQRAFQAAGARTTVTSLWAVPDVATQLLMQRFYENLWDKGLGKLGALVEAQRWVMREGHRRGLDLERAGGKGKALPPYFWAGFVLSGDWR